MQIPRNAVFNKDEVFVVKDQRLKIKKITIEKLNREELLFSGLEEGEMVVTEPLVNAFENMEVTIAGEQTDGQVARQGDSANTSDSSMDNASAGTGGNTSGS